MSSVVVQAGQSLWSIAKSHLPPGASNQTIQTAANELARANGLASDAGLRRGQRLSVPDHLAGRVTTDPAVREGVARLSSPASAPVHPRLAVAAASSAPERALVDLRVAFSDPPRTSEGSVSLPSIKGVPLQGTLERFGGVQTWLDPATLVTTKAVLGELSEAQFESVRSALGGLSKVSYEPGRKYELVDFLPPVLQALVNRDIEVPGQTTVDGITFGEGALVPPDSGPEAVALTINCHGAAWNALRAYQGKNDSVEVFYGEAMQFDAMVRDSPDFEKLGEVPGSEAKRLLDLDLHPGDLVQFCEVSDWMRVTMLLHSAVYVGGGLFFEKPNTETSEAQASGSDPADETPFRLATLENMTKPIDTAVEGRFRIEAFRAVRPLPPAEEAFSSSLEPDFRTFAESHGMRLGNELVTELEPSMGGGVRREYAAALETLPLSTGADGRATVAA